MPLNHDFLPSSVNGLPFILCLPSMGFTQNLRIHCMVILNPRALGLSGWAFRLPSSMLSWWVLSNGGKATTWLHMSYYIHQLCTLTLGLRKPMQPLLAPLVVGIPWWLVRWDKKKRGKKINKHKHKKETKIEKNVEKTKKIKSMEMHENKKAKQKVKSTKKEIE